MTTATNIKKRYCTICKNRLEVTNLVNSLETIWQCPQHGEQKESFIRIID